MDFQLSPGDLLPSPSMYKAANLTEGLGLEISRQQLNALKQQIKYFMQAYVRIFVNNMF